MPDRLFSTHISRKNVRALQYEHERNEQPHPVVRLLPDNDHGNSEPNQGRGNDEDNNEQGVTAHR